VYNVAAAAHATSGDLTCTTDRLSAWPWARCDDALGTALRNPYASIHAQHQCVMPMHIDVNSWHIKMLIICWMLLPPPECTKWFDTDKASLGLTNGKWRQCDH
jgi:hypothetical protein